MKNKRLVISSKWHCVLQQLKHKLVKSLNVPQNVQRVSHGYIRDLKIYDVNFNDLRSQINSSFKTKRMNNFYSPVHSQHRRHWAYNVQTIFTS